MVKYPMYYDCLALTDIIFALHVAPTPSLTFNMDGETTVEHNICPSTKAVSERQICKHCDLGMFLDFDHKSHTYLSQLSVLRVPFNIAMHSGVFAHFF